MKQVFPRLLRPVAPFSVGSMVSKMKKINALLVLI